MSRILALGRLQRELGLEAIEGSLSSRLKTQCKRNSVFWLPRGTRGRGNWQRNPWGAPRTAQSKSGQAGRLAGETGARATRQAACVRARGKEDAGNDPEEWIPAMVFLFVCF